MLILQKTIQRSRSDYIRIAATIALVGNLFLAILKIGIGFFSKSLAVIGDGIDSSTDVLIALLSLGVSFYMNRPSDKEHPWGHGRAETIGTIVLAFVVFFAGAQLFNAALSQIKTPMSTKVPSAIALFVTCFSIFGKALLAISQFILGKKSGSEMVTANGKNMLSDVFISGSVLLGLGLSLLTNMPIIDTITALLVSIWVMKTGISIFLEQNLELMDGNADSGLYNTLFTAVRSVPEAGNPHRARIRKIASRWDIDLDIEVKGSLTVTEAHDIAQKVEQAVCCAIPDVYDIMVHVEPKGHGEHDSEQFGLSAKDL